MKLECAHVAINKVVNHAINPGTRVDRVADLTADPLLRRGILTNPLKTYEERGTFILLDGHRRKAAIERLIEGGELPKDLKVNCVVYRLEDGDDPDLILPMVYSSLNVAVKHRGDEKAAIYLVDPRFLTMKEREAFKEAMDYLGEQRFRLCIDARIDPARNASALQRMVRRLGGGKETLKDKALAFDWFFAKQPPRTRSIRDFEAEWTASKGETEGMSGGQAMALLTLKFAIQEGRDFSMRDQAVALSTLDKDVALAVLHDVRAESGVKLLPV